MDDYIEILIYSTDDFERCKDVLIGCENSIEYDEDNNVLKVEERCERTVMNLLLGSGISYKYL